MSELGAEIDLLTYGEGQDVEIPNVRVLRTPRFAFLGNVKTGPSMLKLFLDVFIVMRTLGLLVRNRYDVVHAHEEAVFFCRFLKPIFRFKLVYDMHSSLPQQLTNFNYTESRLIHGIFKSLEDSSINAADAVITICPDLADYVNTVITDESRHFLIENSIFEPVKLSTRGDATELNPGTTESVPDLDGRIRVVYAGTLEHYQGIELLLQSFRIVSRAKPEAYLLIVGGTDDQVARYREMASDLQISDSCAFTGRLPQQLATGYSESARVLVSPRTEGTNTPLKIYQQLASGIPLVATNIYSHTQVLTDEVAFLAPPAPDDFAAAMLDAITDSEKSGDKTAAALALYDREYSRQAYVKKLGDLLNGLH